jgi:hypothetical protein
MKKTLFAALLGTLLLAKGAAATVQPSTTPTPSTPEPLTIAALAIGGFAVAAAKLRKRK